jgi:DNA-binding NarL/FixJ family response regulator
MTHGSNSLTIPSDRLSAEAVVHSAFVELAHSKEALPRDRGKMPSVVTFLIETNALLREGLGRILSETAYSPAALASSLGEIGPVRTREGCTTIVIMDAAHDHDESCRQARKLKEEDPTARIVMLFEQYDFRQVLDAFHAGANAYLMKSVSCEVLLKTLDLVLGRNALSGKSSLLRSGQGTVVRDGECRGSVFPRARHRPLSRRRRSEQGHRPQAQHRGGHRKGPRQGDSAQDSGEEPDSGRRMGHEPSARRHAGSGDECSRLKTIGDLERHRFTPASHCGKSASDGSSAKRGWAVGRGASSWAQTR